MQVQNSAFTLSDVKKTQSKFHPKDQKAAVYYFMFSKSGFSDKVLKVSETESTFTVTAAQVVDNQWDAS